VEVRKGQDDAVQKVAGHDVDVLQEVVSKPPQDGGDPVPNLLELVERRAKRLQVGTTLLLDVWGTGEWCKSSLQAAMPLAKPVGGTSILPFPMWVKSEVVIVTARGELAAGKGELRESE
jgi:hypothetical protein